MNIRIYSENDLNDFLVNRMKKQIVDDFNALGFSSGFVCIPRVLFVDSDISMSIQASNTHYCYPRKTGQNKYYEFEVGFPSRTSTFFLEVFLGYAEDRNDLLNTVYANVPIERIYQFGKMQGGCNFELTFMEDKNASD